MPIYMDVHESLGEASPEDVAAAHQRDLALQDKYGVRWLTYWFNDAGGKAFCLVESPDAPTAVACHKEAHGLTPHRMIEVSGESMAGFFGEWRLDDDDRAVDHEGSPDDALRTIMFTDIVGSTEVSSRHGDEAAIELLGTHDDVVRHCLTEFSGREVKHTGDGILSSFVSVSRALACAVSIEQQLAAHRSSQGDTPDVSIGMAAGEPVSSSDDLFGASVNLASRLCSHAAPGEILVSRAVRDLAIGKQQTFEAAGQLALKGFDDPVEVFRVAWRP